MSITEINLKEGSPEFLVLKELHDIHLHGTIADNDTSKAKILRTLCDQGLVWLEARSRPHAHVVFTITPKGRQTMYEALHAFHGLDESSKPYPLEQHSTTCLVEALRCSISNLGRKPTVADLEKAIYYIEKASTCLKKEKGAIDRGWELP